MLRSQGIPYLATASAGYIDDFRRKVKKAKDVDGPVYIHVLTPCAAGWRFPPKETVNIARLAVDTGLWPLYEVVDGRLKVTKKTKELNPVTDYIKRQGRFRNISADQIAQLEKVARQLYQELLAQEAKA